MTPPLPPSDPNYRKPAVEHDRFGNVAVYRVQHAHGMTERYLVGRLAPDEAEALRVFLAGWSAP